MYMTNYTERGFVGNIMVLTNIEIIRYSGYCLILLLAGPMILVAIFNISFVIWMTGKEFKNSLICKITGNRVIDIDNKYEQLYLESAAWMERRN